MSDYPRGTFHQTYAFKPNSEPWRGKRHRLLDCTLVIAQLGDPDYLTDPAPAEFAVLDTWTKEKGWFEFPFDYTTDMITGMIAACFGVTPVQIADRIWYV